ncbi:MAG: hypothetical protein K5669_06075 [Lachnospiraceae bacterium]|nr:hypothetical protein [Lachnospiraceae bacterium]
MSNSKEEMEKEVDRILSVTRWQGYASGKVDGALGVIKALNLDDEERKIELLSRAVGLSRETAIEMLKQEDVK